MFAPATITRTIQTYLRHSLVAWFACLGLLLVSHLYRPLTIPYFLTVILCGVIYTLLVLAFWKKPQLARFMGMVFVFVGGHLLTANLFQQRGGMSRELGSLAQYCAIAFGTFFGIVTLCKGNVKRFISNADMP
jgi:xanthosine utilization system XapX-like protein